MKILCRKHYDTLKPVDDAGLKVVGRLKQGETVWVNVTRPRNEKHHRKFWALMKIVADNSKHYVHPEQVADALKVATGHTETFVSHNGEVFYKLRSISFDAMDQDEFSEFYDKCVDIIVRRWLKDLPEGDLRREVEDICQARVEGTNGS